MTIIHPLPGGVENDPDVRPGKPAEHGIWVWWRTGPHPMGHWQDVEWDDEFTAAYYAMKRQFPIMQDKALGEPSDFGGRVCHACNYSSDGYPEPDHTTACDGICKRPGCHLHGESGKESALKELDSAYDLCISRGVTWREILRRIANHDL